MLKFIKLLLIIENYKKEQISLFLALNYVILF